MAYPEYQAEFTDKQPQIGTQCPKCKTGYIEANDFIDKKGVKWYSVVCKKCLTKWMSKYPPKGAEKPQNGAKMGEQILLDEILAFRKEFNTRMDGLKEFLEEVRTFLKAKL